MKFIFSLSIIFICSYLTSVKSQIVIPQKEDLRFERTSTLDTVVNVSLTYKIYKYYYSFNALRKEVYVFNDSVRLVNKYSPFRFGKILRQYQVINNKIIGGYYTYYNNGILSSYKIYSKSGNIISEIGYHKNGNIKYERKYDKNEILLGTDFFNKKGEIKK